MQTNYRKQIENKYFEEATRELKNTLIMYGLSKKRIITIVNMVKDILRNDGGYKFHRDLTRIEIEKIIKKIEKVFIDKVTYDR